MDLCGRQSFLVKDVNTRDVRDIRKNPAKMPLAQESKKNGIKAEKNVAWAGGPGENGQYIVRQITGPITRNVFSRCRSKNVGVVVLR